MPRYLSLAVFFLSGLALFAQKEIELAVQQGHSSDIVLLAVSDDTRYLATYGNDKKVVVWDVKSGGQMFFTYRQGVKELHFSGTRLGVFGNSPCQIDLNTLTVGKLSIPSSGRELTKAAKGNQSVVIEGATIRLTGVDGKTQESRTADYYDQPFHSVVYSEPNRRIYAACEDGNIYVYDEDLKLLHQMKGHLSSANDLALSSDGKFLFSASSDRSVIKWNLRKEAIEQRIYGKSYATYGVSFSPDGKRIYFGDEIGFLKSVELASATLEIQSERKQVHPVLFTRMLADSTFIYAGKDNVLHVQRAGKKDRKVRLHKLNHRLWIHQLFVKKLDLYRPPLVSYRDLDVNPSGTLMVYSNQHDSGKISHYRLYDLEKGKRSPRLFHEEHNVFSPVRFLNDSQFFTLDNGSSLRIWMVTKGKVSGVYHRNIGLGESVSGAVKLNGHTILLLTKNGRLKTIDVKGQIRESSFQGARHIFSLDTDLVAFTDESHRIHVLSNSKGRLEEVVVLEGHQDRINNLAFDRVNRRIASSSLDATVRIWNLEQESPLLNIIPTGSSHAIYITPENYYMMTGKDFSSFGFTSGSRYFVPEQFDPFFNRPDKVLSSLQYPDTSLISVFHQAYLKRLKKLDFTEEMLKQDFHLPEVQVLNADKLPSIADSDSLVLEIRAGDEKYELDRLNVWINDVAIFGRGGISLRDQHTNAYSGRITVPLAEGSNKIQVSVMNQAGTESYRETFHTSRKKEGIKKDLYIIAIGVSSYSDSAYNLTYAAKDARDIVDAFKKNGLYDKVNSSLLLNGDVNRKSVQGLRSFLAEADIDDEVMVFFAGHGVLDPEFNYYLAGHDMNFGKPQQNGIPYEEIENLLDSIRPLKKLLLIDACHSGEIDRDELKLIDTSKRSEKRVFRYVGRGANEMNTNYEMNRNTSDLTRQLFADLRKGTGATVISAAGGMEFAMESARWHNGLFTYSLLQGVKSGDADLNRDGKIMLSELQEYVSETVNELSEGMQKPTSRIENATLDYRVW